jgi:hypothetical protein
MKIELKICILMLLFVLSSTVITFFGQRIRTQKMLTTIQKDTVLQGAGMLRDLYTRELGWLRHQAAQWATGLGELYGETRNGDSNWRSFDIRKWFEAGHADFVVIVRDGSMAGKLYFTPDGYAVKSLPEDLERQLASDPLLSHQGVADDKVSGLIATDTDYYLIASTPILSPVGGDVVATMVIGVRWSRLNLQLSARRMGCGIRLYRWGMTGLPVDVQDAKARVQDKPGIQILGDHVQGYQAYFTLVNLYGQPVVLARVTRPFSPRTASHKLAQSSVLTLLLVMIVLAGVVVLYLDSNVFSRLRALNADLADIEIATHLRGAKVSLTGDDELGTLGSRLNRLLQRLQRNRMRNARGEHYIFKLLDTISDVAFFVSIDGKTIVRPNAAAVDKLAHSKREKLIGIGLWDVLNIDHPDPNEFINLLQDNSRRNDNGVAGDRALSFSGTLSFDGMELAAKGKALPVRLQREDMILFIVES